MEAGQWFILIVGLLINQVSIVAAMGSKIYISIGSCVVAEL